MHQQLCRSSYTFSVELVDFNNDGKLDLWIAGHEWEIEGSPRVYLNPGNGNFSAVTPTVLPAVANLPSTDLEPGRSVSILSTSGSSDALMKALGGAVSEKETYHALLFLGDVGTTHSICDRGLRMAARRQAKTVTYDLTFVDTANEGCAPVGPSLQTEGTLGDTLTLNLSTNNAFVLYPERIVFKEFKGKR